MKKIVYMLTLALAFVIVSCGGTGKIEKVATDYLSKQMKNPESFKVTSVEVRKDTVPYYLLDNITFNLNAMSKELDHLNLLGTSDLFLEDRASSRSVVNGIADNVKLLIKDMKPEVKDIVYVRYMAKNGIGADKAGSAILIVSDGSDPKVEGCYLIDKDFMDNFVIYKTLVEGNEIKKNQFGKFDTEGLPYIETFILDNE